MLVLFLLYWLCLRRTLFGIPTDRPSFKDHRNMIKEEGSDDVSVSGTVMEKVGEDKQQPASGDGDAVKVRILQ